MTDGHLPVPINIIALFFGRERYGFKKAVVVFLRLFAVTTPLGKTTKVHVANKAPVNILDRSLSLDQFMYCE